MINYLKYIFFVIVTYGSLAAQCRPEIRATTPAQDYPCVCIDIDETENLKNFFLEHRYFFIRDASCTGVRLLDVNQLSIEQLLRIEECVGFDANIELALKWAAREVVRSDNFYEGSIDGFIDNLLKRAQREGLECLCYGIARQCYRHKDARATTFYAADHSPADISNADASDIDWSDN